ncbi:hypothetical protein [Selenomonas ruminantium]|uniref:Uncharacterized protein n=1 Tax=Selenomonas ruminantium TaxID=971 RepID=A0A1I0Y9N2_SELRU|nr:hypothetical protein [Selenomonas ruminantium]SFB10059.1 hypothetical protein SAMN05216587_11127 [Selenomonas ruminantium]
MDNKVIAVKADSAFSGFAIHEIIYGIDDKVLFSYQWKGIDGMKSTKKIQSKIRYTAKGKAYFMARKQRQYLDEFMKVGA